MKIWIKLNKLMTFLHESSKENDFMFMFMLIVITIKLNIIHETPLHQS